VISLIAVVPVSIIIMMSIVVPPFVAVLIALMIRADISPLVTVPMLVVIMAFSRPFAPISPVPFTHHTAETCKHEEYDED
jgi:hypothetical protein